MHNSIHALKQFDFETIIRRVSCHSERSEESIFGVLFFQGTKMDSSPSAQNDNGLCGNAYRPFGCASERQGTADYGKLPRQGRLRGQNPLREMTQRFF
jgi:hypothetical protein